ncbi:MBL fold metallo-hydrolase [Alteribacillus iranensis]|uniref:Glyoxylase, beta-lactamase superfamily II n=1 Tax=Alteribacillus iranensis TaxID=930128 RepID=A0A1I2F1J1_9BACI|nr:MBL fold metallo-hydrolase [Alteribacillus iranensis]SFE98568.1 Glyoxylase, beta-lactamase superfamily II [Alteribacillus iranensis]
MANEVTAQQIAEKVWNKESAFILDVRNESDFADWKIEGENLEYLNVPYFELIDGIEPILDKLPKNQDIFVVCAKEGSSKMVADMLEEAGVQASYLKGGMKSWSEYLRQTKVYEDSNMTVYQFVRIGKGCLSYMVISDGEALVVDPSRFVDQYVEVAKEAGAVITHVVDSHLHADHISGGILLSEKTGAAYYLMKSEGAVFDFNPLENYETIEFNQVKLEVLAVKTPGHTPGSVSFFVNDTLLFSGDTIFVSGLGRPDLGNKVREWANDLYETVSSKVSQIADDVIVLPGHYADLDEELNKQGYVGSTLGDIRKRNENMFQTTKEEFLHHVEQSASSVKPPNFEDIVALNRGERTADTERMQELEIGPNRCAVHHTD